MEKNSANIRRIICFGLNEEQYAMVQTCLPAKGYELLVTDCPTDLIAINAFALIIYAPSLDSASVEMISDYYTEVGNGADETVFWLGYPKPPSHLRKKFFCYENVGELFCVFPEKLAKANQRVKKSRAFSKNLADCIQILSLIRLKPGIKTKELSEKLELPMRTVQRHITTLQATGEWIEYDAKKRGWQLQYGVSILFGDHLKDNK